MPCIAVHGARLIFIAVIAMPHPAVDTCPTHAPRPVMTLGKDRSSPRHGALVHLGKNGEIVGCLDNFSKRFVGAISPVIDCWLI